MRPVVEAALTRIVRDQNYRAAVVAWIDSHRKNGTDNAGWTGKSDSLGKPVMNICNGGPPVTVAVETILYVIENETLPEDEAPLSFPPPLPIEEAKL
jgi:hypothetical protein